MTPVTSSRSLVERYLPIGYFAVSAALVAALLPTALRPPQDNPTTSAEFAPDAPAQDEQQQSILGDLGRGRSGTAGAGGSGGEASEAPVAADVPGEAASSAPPRSCPQGFGDPPRQTESLYSATCAPAWQGDNGGSTYKNVSRDEVRVAWAPTGGGQQGSYEGPVPFEPQPGESAQDRTLRVFQDYFNRAYQTYDRTFRIVSLKPGGSEEAQRSTAAEADTRWDVFATYGTGQGFCDEIARRKLVNWCGQKPEAWFLNDRPHRWSWWMDMTKSARFAAEYTCKKLVGRDARFAGDPTMQDQERRLGLLFIDDDFNRVSGEQFKEFLNEQCGVQPVEEVGVHPTEAEGQSDYATAVTRFRAEGVTTVVLMVDFVSSTVMSHAADQQKWYPEWFIPAFGAIWRNRVGQIENQVAWRSAFGISPDKMALPLGEMDCYRAYKSIDPNTNPNFGVCNNAFHGLMQIANGIQGAGPDLTPRSFERGLFEFGHRFYEDPVWAIGGGFGPRDYTYMDNVVEIWWDPSAPDPQENGQGAYRYVRCGQRYRLGELPEEEPRVFSDGIVSTESCPDGSA